MNIPSLSLLLAFLATVSAASARDWRTAREQPVAPEVALPASPTLESYIRRALATNPMVQAAYDDYRASVAVIAQEKSLPFPRATVSHFVEEVQTRTGAQQNTFSIAQTLPWFGKLHAKGRAAFREAEAQWRVFEARRLAVARDVAVAYYDLLDLSETTRLTRESAGLLHGLEPVVETNLRGGGELNDLIRLQVEVGKVQDRLAQLERQRPVAVAKLNALLGREAGAAVPWPEGDLAGGLPPPVPDRREFEAQNPELEALRQRILAGENRVRLARLAAFPDVTLGVNYIQTDEAAPRMTTSPMGEPMTVPVEGSGDDPWAVTLSFELPLWFDRIRAHRREAEARVASLAARLDDAANRLEAELVEHIADMRDARRRLGLYGDDLLPKARQAVELTESSYRANTATTLDFIDAQRSMLELEILYWRAYADYFRSRARAEAIYGKEIK